MSAPLLKIENLTVEFRTPRGPLRAVDGVDLEVASAQTLGLVGESGCGKTTVALSILGLLAPGEGSVTRGRILFENHDLARLDPERLRGIRGNRIAMIFQEPMTALNPLLSIGRQVAEGLTAHRRVTKTAAYREARDWLERVRIPSADSCLSAYPHHLSGGMRQRVMIAMAMICRPALLIADEPTTALDATTQARILSLIAALQAELRMAMLLVSHDLGLIAQTADRVAVMYAGQVVESAPTAALFRAPFHPYTAGLLASLPQVTRRPGEPPRRLREIPGTVPALTGAIAGCRFAGRCPHAFSLCRKECPPLEDTAPGHPARCWLREYPERRKR